MTVHIYSLKRDGDKQLSKNFKVREFACTGYDEVKIDTGLVITLQQIRDYFGKPVNITSAYRPPEYNKKIKTASKTSKHMLGRAADIQIAGVDPIAIAMYAQFLNARGIGLYTYAGGGFVHIDTRAKDEDRSIYRGLYTNRAQTQYLSCGNKFFPALKKGSSGYAVLLLQRILNKSGFDCGKEDNSFGSKVDTAVRSFQRAAKLQIDGSVGTQTWKALLKYANLWY